jgi:uncharacterized protein (TIGR03086 family)
MSLNLRNYTKAVYGFDHVIRSIRDEQWDRPSPCEGWTAKDVASHATGVVRYVESLVRGTAPTTVDGTPYRAWAAARDALLEAVDHPNVLDRTIATPFGEMTVDTFLGVIMADTLTHTWDLARAVGGDECLAPDLVDAAFAVLGPLDAGLRAPGRFDAKVEAAAGDDAQTRYLKFLGRRV